MLSEAMVAPAKAEPHICAIVSDEEYREVAGVLNARHSHDLVIPGERSMRGSAEETDGQRCRAPQDHKPPSPHKHAACGGMPPLGAMPTLPSPHAAIAPLRSDEEPRSRLSHSHFNAYYGEVVVMQFTLKEVADLLIGGMVDLSRAPTRPERPSARLSFFVP